MKTNKKRIIVISLIVFSVLALLVGIYFFRHNSEMQLDRIAETITQSPELAVNATHVAATQKSAVTPTATPYNPFDGKVKLVDYLDITIDFNAEIEKLPEVINIYDSEPIYLDDEIGAEFIKNLEDSGWCGHEFDRTDIEGLYFIGTKENSEIITSTQVYVESAREFMRVSGLTDYFEQEGIELTEEIQGEGRDCTVLYWLTVSGQKTGGYLRIFVESGKNCTECKMYLIKSSVYKTLPSVALEEALGAAFTALDDDLEGQSFTVSSAKLMYYDGMPYYECDVLGKDVLTCIMCYVPAVSIHEILADDVMLENYIRILGG